MMRQKELRIALVCYGGVSLAVYMHGITKELWHLSRASRAAYAEGGDTASDGTAAVYRDVLAYIRNHHALELRILPDIVAGASAGGINGVFLAQAIHSGQSLEPLTQMWLDKADVDVLLDPDARPWSRVSKIWAQPLVWWLLKRPGNAVSASVARETRSEVRAKLSRLIRSRWFEPPFGGLGFSHLLANALQAMRDGPAGPPLLPSGHPIDLFVTATDFAGSAERVAIHSPPVVEEAEHRLSIGFRAITPQAGGINLANPLELVLAARCTASFPGAFPPLQLAEIDQLAAERGEQWLSRERFVQRVLPRHAERGTLEDVALIDGSVLNNRPFAEAMQVLRDRPAQREVDRRFVYIDPHPRTEKRDTPKPKRRRDGPGFFGVILGSLSTIPREQPIRDNLETIAERSRELARLRATLAALRPEVEEAVAELFGRTWFFDRPTISRLTAWRAKAQEAAARQAGYAFNGYCQVKFNGIVAQLAAVIVAAAPRLGLPGPAAVEAFLTGHCASTGLDRLTSPGGGATSETVAFFRDHDLAFRIRRLRLLARRLTEDWDGLEAVSPQAREQARETVIKAMALYFQVDTTPALGNDFSEIAAGVFNDPALVLATIARRRDLTRIDLAVDAMLVDALDSFPRNLRRGMMLSYLGFPYYDIVTLPLVATLGSSELNPAKVDRISPEDCTAIRSGGTAATLRGTEFFNFGAFFSRAYRENDYLWGRLHGAERMIDLMASALPDGETFDPQELAAFKQRAFRAILDEEEQRLRSDLTLIPTIRAELAGCQA